MDKLKILEFFNREYDGPKRTIIFMSAVRAVFTALMVAVVNQSAEFIAKNNSVEIHFVFLYITVCATIIYSLYYSTTQVTIMSVKLVRKMRVRLTDKLRRTELEFLETSGQGRIYARIAQDTDLVQHGTPEALIFIDAALTCIFLLIYVAFISPTGVVFILCFFFFYYGAFLLNYVKIREKLNAAREKEAAFFDLLNDTLTGFKEIKINTRKNNELFADINKLSRETEQLKKEGGFKNNQNIAIAYSSSIGLLGVVVFAVPIFTDAQSETVVKLVALVMFLFGLINSMSRGFPFIMRLNAAVENMEKLEADIDAFGISPSPEETIIPKSFQKIVLKSVSFTYASKEGDTLFSLNPVNLTIRQGDILFVVGGNGSGKTTLLKLLTGLYYPAADGRIILDDQTVTLENYQSYRELFSVIFTDFHMFRKLYGVESVGEQEVKDLLRKMDIHKKTDYVDGKFTNTDLSTGQRKRLAYIAAILEDKPIYVFDEWAADQDPLFRRYFYEKFLQDLRAMNKTVIAISHDDNFFDKADRVITMEEGKMRIG
ncbi:MAG: cyclic peptide export ABC transporter [Desulfobacteraceae bacterium]|nr:cyclic peptide export ABC transporter [Desulfobacteraceae bacterium]